MRIDPKDLQKAVEYIKKNGDPAEIKVDFDIKGNFRIQYYTDLSGQVNITLFEMLEKEASKMPEVTRTDRL
jgi:hypothetical protein